MTFKRKKTRPRLPIAGWREWVALPDLEVHWIKAKLDTGARSSSLHAYDVERFSRAGRSMVRFRVHPIQRDTSTVISCEAELLERRLVRSSSGHEDVRPVIVTHLELLGRRWPIEITLTRRDAMGFRLLLGRQALRRRVLVDSGRSFLGPRLKIVPPGRRNQ